MALYDIVAFDINKKTSLGSTVVFGPTNRFYIVSNSGFGLTINTITEKYKQRMCFDFDTDILFLPSVSQIYL